MSLWNVIFHAWPSGRRRHVARLRAPNWLKVHGKMQHRFHKRGGKYDHGVLSVEEYPTPRPRRPH
jgi:hypothetical protein